MSVPPPASRATPVRRRLAAIGVLLAGALLATGCFRIEISIEVEDDGTGTFTFVSAMEESVLEMMGGDDEGMDGFLDDFDESDLPSGARVEPYNRDGFVGQRAIIPFTHNGDVAAAFAALESDGAGPLDDGGPFDEFELRRDGDRWVFNAAVNVGDELGDEFSPDDEFMRGFFETASFTVRVKMPGRVTDHNADTVASDGALIWNLDIFDPTTREMTATSDPSGPSGGGGDGMNTMLIVAIIVAVVVVVGAVAFLMMRRRPSGGAPAASA
jgi:hypothetical protein